MRRAAVDRAEVVEVVAGFVMVDYLLRPPPDRARDPPTLDAPR
jgi:hypothetical protein